MTEYPKEIQKILDAEDRKEKEYIDGLIHLTKTEVLLCFVTGFAMCLILFKVTGTI